MSTVCDGLRCPRNIFFYFLIPASTLVFSRSDGSGPCWWELVAIYITQVLSSRLLDKPAFTHSHLTSQHLLSGRGNHLHFHLAKMQRRVHCLIQGSRSVQAAGSGIQPTTFWSRTHPPHFHQFSAPALEMGRHSFSPNNIKDCYKYQQPLTCVKAILILKVMLYDSYCDEISIFHYLYSIYLHFSFDYFQILVVILPCVDGLKEYEEWREDEKERSQREREENSWRWKRSASQWFCYKL